MKTTPIYIFLIIFFLNFDLTWGILPAPYNSNLLQVEYANRHFDNKYFSSINFALLLNTTKFIRRDDTSHKLRLNIGLSQTLAELDYELGKEFEVFRSTTILPYISVGTSIYAISYGVGIDIDYMFNKKWGIVANINYRANEKLLGYTHNSQWYQSGLGIKLGIEYFYAIKIIYPNNGDDY